MPSERKHPGRREFIFSAPTDDNRVQFTVGETSACVLTQQGEPLNIFMYPYEEVTGSRSAWHQVRPDR